MLSQSQIDRWCDQTKAWYIQNYPICGYCGHLVRKNGELSHIIRRSYSRELQTVKLNTCLAHHDCHKIWDDDYEQALYLPRITEILYIIYLLDPEFFNRVADYFPELSEALQYFPDIERPELDHHGDLITLQYLFNKT